MGIVKSNKSTAVAPQIAPTVRVSDLPEDAPLPVSAIPPRVFADLDERCRQYRALADQIRDMDGRKRRLMDDLRSMVASAGIDRKVKTDDWLLIPMAGRRTIQRDMLVQLGVSVDVIEAATKTGAGYWEVRGVKAANGEGDE